VSASAQRTGYPGDLGDGRFVTVSGLRTWWTERGEGESPLVLVYGGNFGSPDMGGGGCAMYWSGTFERLSRSRRVVVFDRPGNGYTDAPREAQSYTMDYVVSHLIEFIETLEGGPVHLLGHSRGGFIVTRAALLRQDLVKSLTVVTSGTLGPGVAMNAVVMAGNPYPPASLEGMTWMHQQFSYDASHITDDWTMPFVELMQTDRYLAMMHRIAEEHLLERFFYPGLMRDKRETLQWLSEGRLQRPAHIIWALQDRMVPVQLGYDLFNTIATHESPVTLSVAARSGHLPYREVPEWFDAAVLNFVAEVEADAF
jgi:pimeloyl-ACP methyl ester carboxylesterase